MHLSKNLGNLQSEVVKWNCVHGERGFCVLLAPKCASPVEKWKTKFLPNCNNHKDIYMTGKLISKLLNK